MRGASTAVLNASNKPELSSQEVAAVQYEHVEKGCFWKGGAGSIISFAKFGGGPWNSNPIMLVL